MAADKKNVQPPKLVKFKASKKYGFVETWVSIKQVFQNADVGRNVDSHCIILSGDKNTNGDKSVVCKVKVNVIHIPSGSSKDNYWVSELRSDGSMVISTSNGMMQYLCERTVSK